MFAPSQITFLQEVQPQAQHKGHARGYSSKYKQRKEKRLNKSSLFFAFNNLFTRLLKILDHTGLENKMCQLVPQVTCANKKMLDRFFVRVRSRLI